MFVPLTLAISRIHVFLTLKSPISSAINPWLYIPRHTCAIVCLCSKIRCNAILVHAACSSSPSGCRTKAFWRASADGKVAGMSSTEMMISPGFCGQNMSKFRSVWGTPKRGCQGLNMTSIWGLVNFDAVVNHRSCKFPVEKEHLWHVPKWICLSLFFCQLDAFLINSHSQTRSIYISLAIKPSVLEPCQTPCGRLCHGWTLLVHRLRSPTVLQGQH